MESGEQGAESGRVRINRHQVLEFFDERPKESRGHATAIVSVCGEDLGIGLLCHYFSSLNASVDVERLCTQGTASGVRLDGWLHVTLGDDSTLYQVEIKNWSAHAIFGRDLPLHCEASKLIQYRKEAWARQWHDQEGLRQKALLKVLSPMRPPDRWSHVKTRPLACLWTALHPDGDGRCFFSQRLDCYPGCAFEHLWIFSMSSYLRSLSDEWLELRMPDTQRRLQWLSALIDGSQSRSLIC